MNKSKWVYLIFLTNIVLASCTSSQFSNFVTRINDKLIDGDKELRFISFNVPCIHYTEDYLPFEETNPWRLPDEFEIADAFNSIKQMGGNVIRMYVISVRKEGESKNIIRHVEAPGVFNEEAFKTLDKVLDLANKTGVRVIIPFVDNWWWWGGPAEYASFRGMQRDDFWTDTLLISDFKKTIEHIINRKNTYTGVLYKDDKAILAWETGNELQCPDSWTSEIAGYIKSLDKNHLLIDGATKPLLSDESINDTNTDIVTNHYYTSSTKIIEGIKLNEEIAKGKKPYFVGEFGFLSADEVKNVIDTVIKSNLTGALIWSLRNRSREGGFYAHSERDIFSAYRWPGFPSGDIYEEKEIMNVIREGSYKIAGEKILEIPKPDQPKLFEIENVSEISWQGSTGASSYIIERKDESGWEVIAENVNDAGNPYRSLFSDTTALIGKSYYYRIKAVNQSGVSPTSNEVGPVIVVYKKMIDELENNKLMFSQTGEFEFLTYKDLKRAKEDRNRLTGKQGSCIIYKLPENSKVIKINVFFENELNEMDILASDSLENFVKLNVTKKIFLPEKNDYKFFIPVTYFSDINPGNGKYLKIVFGDGIQQLSRIEIKYGENKIVNK